MKKYLLVTLTAVISGVSIYLNKYAVSGIDPDIFTFSKNLLVGLSLLAILLFTSRSKEIIKLKAQQLAKLLGISVIGGAIPFILFFRGLQVMSSAASGMIHKTMFLYVSFLAFLFLKEKYSLRTVLASSLILVANYLIIKPELTLSKGALLIFSATLLWAVENVIAKQILSEVSGTLVAFFRMFFGSVFIFAYLSFTQKAPLLLSITSAQIIWILVSAGILLLYVLTWYNGLKHVDVSKATAILLLGSPITTLLSFTAGAAILGETLFYSAILTVGVLFYVLDIKLIPWKTD